MTNQNCLIFCNCTADVIPAEKKKQLIGFFHHLNVDVVEIQDLCAYAVHDQKALQHIANRYDNKLIAACYPRAVKNMLLQAGIDMGAFDILNFKTSSIEEIKQHLNNTYGKLHGETAYTVLKNELAVPAWFPVIDQDRCTQCGKCAKFCLFGVYRFERKKLVVEHPLSCKNLCPACGRTCPSQAIIFPRLKEMSVLAGDEPSETVTIEIGEKEHLLVMLNERNQNRRSIIKQSVINLAEEEREKALNEIRMKQRKKD